MIIAGDFKESKTSIIAKLIELWDHELSDFIGEVKDLFRIKKWPKSSDTSLIEQIVCKSIRDIEKKKQNKQYYIANFIAFMRVFQNIFNEDLIKNFLNHKSVFQKDLLIYNYFHLLRNMLYEINQMIEEYQIFVLRKKIFRKYFKSPMIHTLPLYHFSRQVIFGQASHHTFIEKEVDAVIPLTRQQIELRIRRGTGILCAIRTTDQSLIPIPLSRYFEGIKQNVNDISFSRPIECIHRILHWADLSLHFGNKDNIWKYIFVLDYIKPFIIGQFTAKKSWSSDNGIKISRTRLNDLSIFLTDHIPHDCMLVFEKPMATIF